MSSDVAISIKNISKHFVLPHQKANTIKSLVLNPFNRFDVEKQTAFEDISFEVKKGEFFGIVGRNGSGKSTLLKCIAGVYTPDTGKIRVNGKLVPFIELGVGFNPELSGRDNVFLNGALLGFNRKEIAAMYDQIVEFSELERFMDQKLKNYSSGMQVRLAFSIAIQSKGDVLLLDEVLAVGDAAFQKKCNDHFEELRRQNKTVVLVTHDMSAVQRYCTRALMLEDGMIKTIGTPTAVANQYSLDNMNTISKAEKKDSKNKSLTDIVKRLEIRAISPKSLTNDKSFEFEVTYELARDMNVDLGISFLHQRRSLIEHNTQELEIGSKKDTPYKLRYKMPLKYFTPNQYSVDVAIFEKSEFKLIGFNTNSCNFMVTSPNGAEGGVFNTRGEWII